MNKSRFFDVINKINSLLFFVLLVGGGVLVLAGVIMSNQWQDRRAVQVVQDDGSKEGIELILGSISDVPGQDTQFVRLHSRARGGKFSSYSGGGETRNVLFFSGDKLTTYWLYPEHTYVVSNFAVLTNAQNKYNKDAKVKEVAKAIYIETIKSDTNEDGELDRGDLVSVSLSKPDGKGMIEIETGVQSIIDYSLVDDYQQLVLLHQKDNKVILKKYSLSTFEVVSENVIEEITRRL